ncbi:uncharacterized protein [Lolium perenne]|uniref:uncharacterized protein n=1 Tax=Lolium perenne TaxID=4522 RepID=UPI003A99757B
MPPRRCSSSGYRGVRARPSGHFDAEIRSGEERIRLGTFEMAHEAACAYDAAEALAPPSPAVTREQQRRQRELEQWLVIAERDERLRLEWARQFPEDVAAMEAFYAQMEEEKAAAAKKKMDRDQHHGQY